MKQKDSELRKKEEVYFNTNNFLICFFSLFFLPFSFALFLVFFYFFFSYKAGPCHLFQLVFKCVQLFGTELVIFRTLKIFCGELRRLLFLLQFNFKNILLLEKKRGKNREKEVERKCRKARDDFRRLSDD